jgi:hypothetical protein
MREMNERVRERERREIRDRREKERYRKGRREIDTERPDGPTNRQMDGQTKEDRHSFLKE